MTHMHTTSKEDEFNYYVIAETQLLQALSFCEMMQLSS